MMTGTITDDQARHLSALIASLRPGWDIAGIRAALSRARHRAPADQLAIAAIRAAMTPEARTPAIIALDGPHWVTGGIQTRDTRRPKCETHGVETRVSDGLCPLCLADQKGGEPGEGASAIAASPERLDAYSRGARIARAALQAKRTTTTEEQS